MDEVDLEDEGLVLGAHDDVVEARSGSHEARHHGALVGELHVLAHAAAQVLGLAHVEHIAGSVFPQVAARVCGDEGNLLGDRGRGAGGGGGEHGGGSGGDGLARGGAFVGRDGHGRRGAGRRSGRGRRSGSVSVGRDGRGGVDAAGVVAAHVALPSPARAASARTSVALLARFYRAIGFTRPGAVRRAQPMAVCRRRAKPMGRRAANVSNRWGDARRADTTRPKRAQPMARRAFAAPPHAPSPPYAPPHAAAVHAPFVWERLQAAAPLRASP